MLLKSVLFLCTGNSARSVLAEAYLNHAGGGRFKAYSAGSQPAGKVNPLALQLLSAKGIRTAGFRSKSWNEFASMPLDLIFTVCDNAAAETCPVWPGKPATAHWGVPDPAAVQGSDAEKRAAFERAYVALSRRIERLIALPVETLDRQTL
ncbi:MAG TPA: arsenate reductase ArsC, partial [Burkholderiales bacterium]|nr:arsenate reductase ArsC [Burkholderiales bacterium]